jgi:hypothetical protein
MPAPNPVEQLSRPAAAFLAAVGVDEFPTHIRFYFPSEQRLKLTLKGPHATAAADRQESPREAAGDLREAILGVLADAERPLKSPAIARRAGRPYNSYFRTVVKSMREASEIVLTPDGTYTLPPDE